MDLDLNKVIKREIIEKVVASIGMVLIFNQLKSVALEFKLTVTSSVETGAVTSSVETGDEFMRMIYLNLPSTIIQTIACIIGFIFFYKLFFYTKTK
ncbi:MAG: hypothetical protein LBT75_02070 [Bacilli bacterium]|jgi:hypothetical protein|nr:hypothetical protein [Bacilli bacterium]